MSRLPHRLQRWWPVAKLVHRTLSRHLGRLFRIVSVILGERGVPTRGTTSSWASAEREPGAVVVRPVGPAETWRRHLPEGNPDVHPTFTTRELVDVPARYVLEVSHGRLVGAFAATVTPGKVLDYQVSGYFGIRDWREHPLFLRPTLGHVTQLPGTALSLTARGTSSNYYHFLYDAIGRLSVLDEAAPGLVPDAVVVPHQLGYQRQLLAMVGIESPLVQPRPGHTVLADRLIVPSTPNQDLDAPRSVTSWLRMRLPPREQRGLPRRLYVTRGEKPNTRRYVQEADLWPALERRGFAMVDPGTLSVQEQIDLFHAAEVVVAPHGAGLTNLTFCRPGTGVLELFAPSYVHLGLWAICESIGDIDYRYLVGAGRPAVPGRMTGVLEDVSLPPGRILEVVDDLLA